MKEPKDKPSGVEVSRELLRLIGRLRKNRTITTAEIEWLTDTLLTALSENTDLEGRLDWESRKVAGLEADVTRLRSAAEEWGMALLLEGRISVNDIRGRVLGLKKEGE